jgi:two-component system, chemotaxis family, sensor kinase CheA
MSALLEQFLSEARDFLQGIGEKLMQLEKAPADAELMTELFRFVHTLKGNSGLFDFPEMTRVLHAGEDLMDAVRQGRVTYSRELADHLLDAMDFVRMLCDEIERTGAIGSSYAAESARLGASLRQLIGTAVEGAPQNVSTSTVQPGPAELPPLETLPEAGRMAAFRLAHEGKALHWLTYTPEEGCFFSGDDPFFQARQTPGLVWGGVAAREDWPKLLELDAYRCILDFHILSTASQADLDDYFRYMPDQIRRVTVPALMLVQPQGDSSSGPVYEDFVVEALEMLSRGDSDGLAHAARTRLELSDPELWLSSALRWLLLLVELEPDQHAAQGAVIESLRSLHAIDWLAVTPAALGIGDEPDAAAPARISHDGMSPTEQATLAALVTTQRAILHMPVETAWQMGRVRAVATTLGGFLRATRREHEIADLDAATAAALDDVTAAPLLAWLDRHFGVAPIAQEPAVAEAAPVAEPPADEAKSGGEGESEIKFGRRAEDAFTGPRSIKVDQAKIDLLMNLIGEIVVAKNALPYLAGRAETVFGVRELSREIKAQYAVINRIAEEMQDAIMQVRMMPVSFVFQRFPRLVRDISRKLGKEVKLVLEGEETEADKNVIESLGDPLVHIVRNSLDHGFELPEVRRAAGKPAEGNLTIRATQESDRVVIEIQDDGKGIDPEVVKRKAYEKGLIDEETLERLSDQEAVNLVFMAGFSMAEVISDLSGRGVGMDVVRTAIAKVNGTVTLDSEKGRGTRIRLSLPLSMAVTNVMIIESNGQIFGLPMDSVVETVRVARADIRIIKRSMATVLRGRIVALKALNSLLGLATPPIANDQDELAVLVVRMGDESVGLLVDDFRETVDIILKPMTGVLGGLACYSGSALMGDGSVLMVLNVKELM